jgi:hypothetical protein
MHELLYHYWCYPVMLMGGNHQINTSYVAAGAVLILLFCLIAVAVLHTPKASHKNKVGGEIIVNRNDPTRDFIRWELMSWPDDWEDGDRLIFTVVEQRITTVGPEVEVKK